MSLQATVTQAVATAFRAAGDLVKSLPLEEPGTLDDVTETETPGATGAIDVIQLSQADAEKHYGRPLDNQASDVQLMADAASATLAPAQGQKATWGGAVYQLHAVDNSNPALLLLQLRRPV